MTTADSWLAQVRHDLVKRLLWPARDRRDLGGAVRPGELCAALINDEGAPTTAAVLWAALRAGAPPEIPAVALDAFAVAIDAAVLAASAGDLAGVLNLEAAFAELTAAAVPNRRSR